MRSWLLLPIARRSVGTLLFLGIVVAVVMNESHFDRPRLSVRPQLWSAKQVEWEFVLASTEVRVSTSSGKTLIELTGTGELAERRKVDAIDSMMPPIETGVLVTTLIDVGLSKSQIRLSFVNAEGIKVSMQFSPKDLKIEGTTIEIDAERPEVSLGEGDLAGNSVEVIVDTEVTGCEPRESRVHCPLVDFSSADLSRADLDRANLRGADLSGAMLNDVKLGGADLSGAVLRDVSMRRAWLVGVDLSGAFMEKIDFTGASWTN